eukprot:SAG11_NODE_13137_length_668_cov_1.205624_1_plen_23_part_01
MPTKFAGLLQIIHIIAIAHLPMY